MAFSGSPETKSYFIRSTGAYDSCINGIDKTARSPLIAAMTGVGLAHIAGGKRAHTDEHIFVTNALHDITGGAVKLVDITQLVELSPSCDRANDWTQQWPKCVPKTRNISKKHANRWRQCAHSHSRCPIFLRKQVRH